MRNKIIGLLLLIGALLAITLSITLIVRALYFASHTGSLAAALIGTALGAASIYSTFKLLGETAEHAENGGKQLLLKDGLK